jgi:hypothetical protein
MIDSARVDAVIAELAGSSRTIESVLADAERNDVAFLSAIDAEIGQCETCDWWVERGELDENETCDDCRDHRGGV